MKKFLCLVISMLLCLTFVSCGQKADSGNDNNNDKEEEETMLTVEDILSSYSKSKLKCDSFSLSKYMEPYWKSQIIYNETVAFYEENGSVADKKLMYDPAKILEVRSYDLKTLYVEGTDYEMTESGIKWLTGSAIPTSDFDYYYLDAPFDGNAAFRSISHPDKYVAYNEFNYFIDKTVCVTYIRTEKYSGPEQSYSSKMDGFVNKLKNKENVTMLFYGDSIMEGCNASGYRNTEPNMPKFSELVTSELYAHYGYTGETTITSYNKAVGGWLSSTGVERWNQQIGSIVPDCFLLNFGCNDGTFSASPQSVLTNLRIMINRIKKVNPDCAIIVISSFIPNTDAKTSESESTVRNFANNQADYEQTYIDLCEEYDDAVCVELTSFYNWILQRKSFYDIIASGISHPNDFFCRAYAQMIVAKLIED